MQSVMQSVRLSGSHSYVLPCKWVMQPLRLLQTALVSAYMYIVNPAPIVYFLNQPSSCCTWHVKHEPPVAALHPTLSLLRSSVPCTPKLHHTSCHLHSGSTTVESPRPPPQIPRAKLPAPMWISAPSQVYTKCTTRFQSLRSMLDNPTQPQ
jgi:hypothetical protein